MTLEEFLPALERRTREMDTVWLVNADGEIRTDDGHCPLSYVADTTPCVVAEALRSLKMAAEEAWPVVSGADSKGAIGRAQVLSACRLVEVI